MHSPKVNYSFNNGVRGIDSSPGIVQPCAFEQVLSDLGLKTEADMKKSEPLRVWVKAHKHNHYVPENLLKHWHFDPSYDGDSE